MKRFWRVYVATLDRPLAALFLLCLLVIVSHDILFAGEPELFSWAGELWNLVYQLCLAFAASYIFYLVVVHAKRQHDRENLRPFLQAQTQRIVGDARSIIDGLQKESGHEFDGDHPNSDDLKAMCSAVTASTQAPLMLGPPIRYATWMELLDFYRGSTKQSVGRILAVVPFLESDHVDLLTDLDSCLHFTSVETLRGNANPSMNLGGMSTSLHAYLRIVWALEEYAAENFKKPA